MSPPLMKVICKDCRKSIVKCICDGPDKARAIEVRVFTEDDVRQGYDQLEAGEPLAALMHFRDLLGVDAEKRRPILRRL